MKKNSIIALLVMVLAFSTLCLVGCLPASSAYIKVTGLKTEYIVGEQLDTSSATIQYYSSAAAQTYTPATLTTDMVSGFSSETVGTFTMTITYNKLSTTVDYVVKKAPGPITTLTEQQATDVLEQAIVNMKTYAEIKTTTVAGLFGASSQTYIITRPEYQYSNNGSDGESWLFKNQDKWEYYSISYDVFDEVWENKKYEAVLDYDNLIELEFRKNFSTAVTDIEFVEGYQQDGEYVIVYGSPDIMDAQSKYVIKDNKIISITNYFSANTNPVLYSTTTVTYFTEETSSIPPIPNKDWEDGGFYWIAT
jgi:hypothetical protein